MFFEEESKDTHGNMDDYDLNFEQDESVSWDKLLDDTEPADDGLELVSDEKVEADDDISIADDLLDMDDESFDNFIQEQKQNIIKNREESDIDDLSTADDLKFDISQDDDDLLVISDSDDELVLEEAAEETVEEVEAPAEESVEAPAAEEELELQEVEEIKEEPEIQAEAEEEVAETVEEVLELEEAPLVLEETQEVVETVEEVAETTEETTSIDDFLLEDVEENAVEEVAEVKEEVLADLPDEDTNNIEVAFGVDAEGDSQEEIDLNEFLGEEGETKAKKTNPVLFIAAGAVLVIAVVFFLVTNVFNKKADIVFEPDTSVNTVENLEVQNQDIANTDIGNVSNTETSQTGDNSVINVKVTTDETVKTPVVPIKKEVKKAKEPAKAEKVTLKVVDSGRQTPFVPVAGVNNLGFATSPKIEIAKPFNTLAEPDPMFDKLMNITVSGILYDGSQNPSAVINVSGTDYFVQKGDKVDTFTVIGITQDTVVIKEKNNVFQASIGQNFTTIGSIDGEIQTVNLNNRQIQRLYKTSGDTARRPSSNQEEYESLDEIGINTK